ncbi:MAG: TIGR04149 family rSAM-modified RiPP [Bacteroidaceae bacterium]|nr:TIGR04149 family rSAM-modified RiPP [Bacteroidaceae bacterium]
MKKLNSIKLAQLNEQELSKREMNRLIGGAELCCICGCEDNQMTRGLLNSYTAHNASSDLPGFLYGNAN